MTEDLKTAATSTLPPKGTRKAAAAGASTKTETDAFAFGAAEMPEMLRSVAEKSVQSAKDTYEKVRIAAEDTTDMLEDQMEVTRSGLLALNGKMLEATKTNVDAVFQFAHDVMAVKTVAEAIELQSAFARKQFELVSAQAKDMQSLFQKVTTDAAKPAKDVFAKFSAESKAA